MELINTINKNSKHFTPILFLLLISFLLAGCTTQPRYDTNIDSVHEVYGALQSPWGMAFINENEILITQKAGTLLLVNLETEEHAEINDIPAVDSSGQGGLLDVAFDDEFVYLSYSIDGSTHVGRGILNREQNSLDEFAVLFNAEPALSGGAHFGSRILLHEDYIFFTTGDRGQKNFGSEHVSQNYTNTLGSVIRLYRDGTIPLDNPFGNAVYSYGHRNPQGIALHPETEEIWISNHGERDGDGIYILEKGGNFGWPIASHGCRYGTSIPVGDKPEEREDIVNPVYYWECGSGGFPPAGMAFYEGDLFVGGLAVQYLAQFSVEGREVHEMEPVFSGYRVRDVEVSPDGFLYALVDEGKLFRVG